MFIGIIVFIILLVTAVTLIGGALKKVMEVASFIAKFCFGCGVSQIIYQSLPIKLESLWGELAILCVGAFIVMAILGVLAANFRLISYAVNYFICSFIVLLIAIILKEKATISFATYAITLLLFPRIMWISDRLGSISEYNHTEYGFGILTDVYTKKAVDWWGGSEDAWGHMLFQIVAASFFYLVGSLTLLSVCPIEAGWKKTVYFILAIVTNILFDFFIFRRIEEHI